MEQYKFESGDLELLAMGLLPPEQESGLLLILKDNEVLKEEYLEIENALFLTSNENGVEPAANLKEDIAARIFSDTKSKPFFNISVINILRIAAAILLVGSIAFNLFLLDSKSKIASKDSAVESKLGELPFEEEVFKEMFAYLKGELSTEPCAMDFRTTKSFLASRNLDTPENLAFLKNHDGHCDCEVLMNVAQYFPNSKYHHGDILPKVHMSNKPMAVSFLRDYRPAVKELASKSPI